MGRLSTRIRLGPSAAALAAVTLAVMVGASGAGGIAPIRPGDAERASQRAGLKAFGSCDRLRGYLRRHREALEREPLIGGIPDVAEGAAGADSAGTAPLTPSSPTNVQEQGVDEPDLVKASGSIVFILSGDRLRALDVSGEQPAVLGSIALPNRGGEVYDGERQLLVAGDRALVIARAYGARARTLLTELDLSDPAAISEVSTLAVEGSYVSARLTGATARVVVSAFPELPAAERGNGRAWMPGAVLRDRASGERTRRRLLGCGQVHRPRSFSGTSMISVLTIDLARGLPAVDSDAVMAGGEIVYGSPTSLYVASQRWLSPGDVMPDSQVSTEIHRFDVSDPDSTEYVASGEVEGYMLSQWSISEHEGVLRVASTTAPPWLDGETIGESESFVTTLATEGDRLTRLGRVGGLGRGEQIYAVRFAGELGYVVTFRQVDPLYTLDLTDPRDPRAVGELKIPGYSAYLHPVGDGLLLGVGQDANNDGATTGVQVSLFDVSDPTDPLRVARVSLGRGTYSEVEYDHHAFTWSPDLALAVIPLDDWSASGREFHGAAGVRLDPATGLAATPRTSHGDGYEAAIRRSLVVGGRLFTISGAGLAEHDPTTLERLSLTSFSG